MTTKISAGLGNAQKVQYQDGVNEPESENIQKKTLENQQSTTAPSTPSSANPKEKSQKNLELSMESSRRKELLHEQLHAKEPKKLLNEELHTEDRTPQAMEEVERRMKELNNHLRNLNG